MSGFISPVYPLILPRTKEHLFAWTMKKARKKKMTKMSQCHLQLRPPFEWHAALGQLLHLVTAKAIAAVGEPKVET